MKNHSFLLKLFALAFLMFAAGCGKNDEKINGEETHKSNQLNSENSKNLDQLKSEAESLEIVPDPKPSTDSFLPKNYKNWEDFEKKNTAFRKKRAAAQNELPINKDGSRVWLGQIVYVNDSLDNQIKTFAMSKKLVKGSPECAFMKMDGDKINFDDPALAVAIGKLAAKKYVKIFGTIDDENNIIHNVYINVAGMNYIFQNGKLVKESERLAPKVAE